MTINTYKEGKLEIEYNSDYISDTCVDCKGEIIGNLKKNYEARGNYCGTCNAKYATAIKNKNLEKKEAI